MAATFAPETGDGASSKPTGCEKAGKLEDFKIVGSTGNLPNEVIAARADYLFDAKQTADMLGVFGRMSKSDEGKKVLKEAFEVEGWGLAVEGDFDPVLAIVNGGKGGKPKLAQ